MPTAVAQSVGEGEEARHRPIVAGAVDVQAQAQLNGVHAAEEFSGSGVRHNRRLLTLTIANMAAGCEAPVTGW